MNASGPAGDAVMLYLTDPDGRVLMVRPRGLLRDHWMPPGGHIEPEESAALAACRELVEELALQCSPADLHELGSCTKDVGTGTLTLFAARRHEGTMNLGEEILEARWVDANACGDLPILPATAYGLELLAARQNC